MKSYLVIPFACTLLLLPDAGASAQATPHQPVRKAGQAGAGSTIVLPRLPRVLIFSRTTGYRHGDAIDAGKIAIIALGHKMGFAVDTTEDATKFTEENLKRYHAVFFLATTGDVLNDAQQADFMRFIQAGGGYIGTHSATDTEYEWLWYGKLAGAYFAGHGSIVPATVRKALPFGNNTLPDSIIRSDEWYNYKSISKDIKVIYTLDESTYQGGKNGPNHPIAWYHDFDGGRAFYTGFGHVPETYSQPVVLDMLSQALAYVIGRNIKRDYSKVRTPRFMDETRFTQTTLDFNLNEPMEMGIMPDGKILFIERPGGIKIYNPVTGKTKEINRIKTLANKENGLLGMALDPAFATNHWVYFYYGDSTQLTNHLSRFTYQPAAGRLDPASEKILLDIPFDDNECCHWAGGLAFGPDKNLYLSTGDNTNPGAFPSVDGRPGHLVGDAQRTSGNTNDLRGKILRIHPEPNGTYTIPDGNLFPKGEEKTRPEIYVMGLRNPFRLSVDQKTGFLYWGDVGPDANKEDSVRGPRGYDEIDQARTAGNFGWPYFIGNNYPYKIYDYAKDSSFGIADSLGPVNDSPNNTGKRILPPPKPALIWYPYEKSPDFPMTKTGSRVALAGPLYYSDQYKGVPTAFPNFLDGKLLAGDMNRGWLYLVSMDQEGAINTIEPFMPNTKFNGLVHMAYGPDGRLYLLYYGRGVTARLTRVDYNSGNRKPIVQMVADRTAGALPMTVHFTTDGTYDPDGDAMTYILRTGNKQYRSLDGNFTITYTTPGVQTAVLTVTDAKGAAATATTSVIAGNEPPVVHAEITGGNKTFFFPNTPAEYAVTVTDKEDGSTTNGTIRPEAVKIKVAYQQGFSGMRSGRGMTAPPGKALIAQSDCMNCHQLDKKLIGPAFMDVSAKYQKDRDALARLAAKIIRGGSGVWGTTPMAAHPQLSPDDASLIVNYLMTLAKPQDTTPSLPLQGSIQPKTETTGAYTLSAMYTDRGPDHKLPALDASDFLVLRAPVFTAEELTATTGGRGSAPPRGSPPGIQAPDYTTVIERKHNSNFALDSMDLTGVTSASVSVYTYGDVAGGDIDVRLDSQSGPIIGTITFANAERTEVPPPKRAAANPGTPVTMLTAGTPITKTVGEHKVVLVFRNAAAEKKTLFYFKKIVLSNR